MEDLSANCDDLSRFKPVVGPLSDEGLAEFGQADNENALGGGGASAAGRWDKNGLASGGKLVLNVLYQRRFLYLVQPTV